MDDSSPPAGRFRSIRFRCPLRLSKDGKYLLVLNGGYNPPSISVLRADTMEETSRTPVADGWLGLDVFARREEVYVGGGSRASVFEFALGRRQAGAGTHVRDRPRRKDAHATDFIGDVASRPTAACSMRRGCFTTRFT